MTEITIGDTQTYTLPLERIDLTYLSKYVPSSRNGTIPLWSKKCLEGESEYFEIQILSQEVNENDCYCESSATYTCHICDLDVPKLYLKEHNESQLHVKLKNIFDKVLARVAMQINSNLIEIEKDVHKDVYYCETCSKVIKLKNRYNHESSDFHRQSIENFKILNDFHKIFNRVDDFDVDENIATDESVNSNKEHTIIENDIAKKNYILFQQNDEELDSDDEFLSSEEGVIMKADSSNAMKHNETSFKEYLKEMIEKFKLAIPIPSTEGDFIYMVAPNGDRQKVSRQNFHSYLEINESMYCQVCKFWISKNRRAHDVTEIHVRNIFKPINNEFYRMINNVANHCVLCNELFHPHFDHKESESHKPFLKTIQTSKLNYNTISKTEKTFCNYCNVYIDTHNFSGHTNSRKHNDKKDTILKQNKITILNTGEYICNYCNVLLTENIISVHIKENAHINKKNDKNDEQISEFCELCEVDVPKGGMETHNEGYNHRIVVLVKICLDILNAKYKNENEVKNENSTQNDSKDSSIATSSQDLNQTSNTNDNSIGNQFEEYSKFLTYSDKSDTTVICTVCDVRVPNNERNISEHMKGRIHVETYSKKHMGDYAKYLEYTNGEKTKVKCRICDVNIPLVEKNIFEHMNGRAHEIEVNLLVHFNHISKESTCYFCSCCDMRFFNFFDHINSDLHTENYQEKCVIDRKLMRNYVYDDNSNHSIALRYRFLYRDLLRVNQIEKLEDGKFFCDICGIELSRISEIDHMLGERHKLRKQEVDNSILTRKS